MGHPEEPPIDMGKVTGFTTRVLAGGQQVVQHRTGAECTTGTGEHDGAHALFGLELVEGGLYFVI